MWELLPKQSLWLFNLSRLIQGKRDAYEQYGNDYGKRVLHRDFIQIDQNHLHADERENESESNRKIFKAVDYSRESEI